MINSLAPLNYRPRTPGVRWRTRRHFLASNCKIEKQLTNLRKWHGGRTAGGRVCRRGYKSKKYRKKSLQTAITLPRFLWTLVKSFCFRSAKNKLYALCQTNYDSFFYIPATESTVPGRVIYKEKRLTPGSVEWKNGFNFVGLPIKILSILDYKKISNIALQPFVKYKYALSSGTYATKLQTPKREKKIRIQLPSEIVYYVPTDCLCIVGRAYQQWTNKYNLGKAGVLFKNGRGPLVRGIAMNPVDHPHGGKANSSKPERSPWGWVTKKSH